MPNDPRRDEREKSVIDALTPVFDEYREAATASFRENGELPARAFWETMRKRLASAVEPAVALAVSDALNAMLRPTFSSVATPDINRQVARDAKRRSEEFATNFSNMVLGNIADKAPKAKDDEAGVIIFIDEMFNEIFADNKKTIIAVGLVTAAITAGEMFAAVYIQSLINRPSVAAAILEGRPDRIGPIEIDYTGTFPRPGERVARDRVADILETVISIGDAKFEMVPTWMTQEDALVCPICGPLHRMTWENWGEFDGPPAHYMCRCYLEWIIRLDTQT